MRRLNIISLGFNPFAKFFFRHFGLFFTKGFKFIRIKMIMRPAKGAVVFFQVFFSFFLFVFFIFVFHNNMIAEKTQIFNL